MARPITKKLANNNKNFDVKKIPLVPTRDVVFFPSMVIPLTVGREKSIIAVEEAMLKNRLIFICAQKNYMLEDPAEKDLYEIGVICKILQLFKMPDGSLKILVEGLTRATFSDYSDLKKYIEVEVNPIINKKDNSLEMRANMRAIIDLFDDYCKMNRKIPIEINQIIVNLEDADELIDTISSYLSIKLRDKQDLLSIKDKKERIKFLEKILVQENEILSLERKIHGKVRGQIEKAQKEYYLTEQIKVIQKELNKKDEGVKEIEDFRAKIASAKMSQEAEKLAITELKKLEKMGPYSPEANVTRNYLDWLVSLPWAIKTPDKLDIAEAKKILDEDHYGLEKVKERILEYLAVCKLNEKLKGPILCFIGPPGVGKTSIASSIARAMSRKFVRISLGGVRDEAEIRGHRRTYIGALPGRIIQSIKKAGSKNPVFLLDEIDKLGSDFRGDPSSALLEVLDSEQNNSFSDHYLEVGFDLSDVMFITTANNLYNIPSPLLDRMEIVDFSGYTNLEKMQIAKKYLIPKEIKNMGLVKKDISFSDESINKIATMYTEETGVRNLRREISSVCRKVARKKAELGLTQTEKIDLAKVEEYLGVPKYNLETFTNNEIGIATGLAWTEVGGEILNIEVSRMPSKGGLTLTLTGKLGEVMKESAQTGLSYLRANYEKFGIPKKAFEDAEIHIHVPEGAIPKDGPSAGITMTTAMLSAFTKRKIKSHIAMTGEITLSGRILPIGGLKEKALAAYRTHIKKIFIPEINKKDLKEIPKEVLDKIEIILVSNFTEIVDKVLVK